MQVTRYGDAQAYEAPGHFDVRTMRLQGFDASDAKFAWTGLTHFLPGGGAEMSASPLEKIYVVLEGEVTVELGDGTIEKLGKLDSCYIGGGVERAVRNERNDVATMLVVMPYPEPAS
jgi:mannose-6-phosphate isomerase-like protein (cupin superfamily)